MVILSTTLAGVSVRSRFDVVRAISINAEFVLSALVKRRSALAVRESIRACSARWRIVVSSRPSITAA
jgi:hypothetical protein